MINLITDLISFTQPTNLDKESLSVIESIAKIKKVVNECITQFNNLEKKTEEDYENFLNQITNYKNEVIKIINDIKNDNNSFKNEFREIIKSLENFNVTLEIIKKQSEYIQDLAKINQDNIDKGTIATKDEINKINTSLEENTNDLTTIKRKFKSEFGRNLYWADGSSGVVSEAKKKEQIDECVSVGIDSVVLPIQTKYNNGSMVIVNDLDNDLKWLQYAQAQGLKVSCIKMHNYRYTSDDIASNYTNFKTQYKTIIDTVSTKFQNMNIEIFTVMNEETQYFMGMDNADNSFILDLFTTVKAKGFKVGITTAGYNYSYRVSENILSKSDVICANTYVRIGSKRERTTNLDSIKAWQEDSVNDWLTYMKGKYPNAEIILSETGCMDYWAALQTPSSFTYPSDLQITTNNKAVDIYYTGMFETMSEKVDRVWNWFNLPSVDVCKKYLKGGYGNE